MARQRRRDVPDRQLQRLTRRNRRRTRPASLRVRISHHHIGHRESGCPRVRDGQPLPATRRPQRLVGKTHRSRAERRDRCGTGANSVHVHRLIRLPRNGEREMPRKSLGRTRSELDPVIRTLPRCQCDRKRAAHHFQLRDAGSDRVDRNVGAAADVVDADGLYGGSPRRHVAKIQSRRQNFRIGLCRERQRARQNQKHNPEKQRVYRQSISHRGPFFLPSN